MIHPTKNTVLWRWNLSDDPFGTAKPDEDPDGNRVNYTLNLRFSGQFFDSETGLVQNGHRTLDPPSGRYLENDPIGQAGGMSTYGYANQNPLRFNDPDGLKAFDSETSTIHTALESGVGYFESQTPWMNTAASQLGVREYKEAGQNNPQIIAYHATTGGFKTDEVPWCSSFANWSMENTAITGTHNAMASSWKKWGQSLSLPAYGSVAVIVRGNGSGHVGFVVGKTKSGNIVLLGGNQNNSVKYTSFEAAIITKYVYPAGYMPFYSLPILEANGAASTR